MLAQERDALFRVGDRWDLAGRDPPQREVDLGHLLEPLAPPAEHLEMTRLVILKKGP